MLKELFGVKNLEKRLFRQESQLKKVENVLRDLQERVSKIEGTHPDVNEQDKKKILRELKQPMTTTQLAKKLNKHRSWISLLLNQLEKEGRVKEVRKRGREIVYGRE